MKKLIIFDLDGVIFNSKENMQVSWQEVTAKLGYKINFKKYFSNIGLPFEIILKKIGIKKNILLAKKIYREKSIKSFNLIRLYPDVKRTLKYLRSKNNYKIGVITSKEKPRALKLIKKFNLKFHYIQCPVDGKKGKPYPYLLNRFARQFSIKKNNIFYIGDTLIDYQFAKNSKINFIYCKYGYGKINLTSVKKINKFKELSTFF